MAEQDAPNYTRAVSPGTSCAGCEAFQRNWCVEYDFSANPAWTCDSWHKRAAEKPPITVPSGAPIAAAKEYESAGFAVFKDAKGKYRWVIRSSDSFEDRDKEVVSRKALEADVARSDVDGDLGPLRWWHVGNPSWPNPLDWTTVRAGPGIDLGTCDFSAMVGSTLIESGTFKNERLGAAIAAKASELAASLGFSHPLNEPDAEGVYHHIRRFERSLTPRHKASNPRTGVLVAKEKSIVNDQKLTQFKELVGDDVAAETLQDAGVQEKAARTAGIREKEAVDPLDQLLLQAAELQEQITSLKAQAADAKKGTPPVQAASTIATEEKADDGEESPPEDEDAAMDGGLDDDDGSGMYVGDMTVGEFKAMMDEHTGRHLGPVAKALDLHGQMNKTLGEMKSYLGGLAQKDSTLAELREQLITMATSLKEAQQQLIELQGSAPRALAAERQIGYKASEGADNTLTPASQFYEQPQAPQSPFGWVDQFVVGTPSAG